MPEDKNKRVEEIQNEIRQILRFDWNPINIEDLPLDEYDSYIGSVYRILAGSRSEDDLIKYLDKTAAETIFGMPDKSSDATREALRPIAKKLLALNVKL
jgi:hypothetical protein